MMACYHILIMYLAMLMPGAAVQHQLEEYADFMAIFIDNKAKSGKREQDEEDTILGIRLDFKQREVQAAESLGGYARISSRRCKP